MADAPKTTHKEGSKAAAIIGWGGLLVFMGLFAWLVINQIRSGEIWTGKEPEAIALVRDSKPPEGDGMTLGDMLKGYSLRVRDLTTETGDRAYVGEFSWDASQKSGPEFEVQLRWKENQQTRVALWRVDLEKEEVRPQGAEASSLPRRAAETTIGD
jgi:hypothetical protein